ncbi:glycerophosphocholine acyltransferase 1 isoform X2 [Ziziphus jujuba]|uniref:Glycerophosphocholine acyltransferase 1 n=1 Tax=Ziziphus jujuba TaxID=326968 RepID=A0A6P6GG38_ZIZJJ|nr:glycerophosphocholine acyltransferase 1 isoform X2 [Ziziphus jujuba]
MSSNEELVEDANGDSFQKVKQNLKDRSKKVAQTKEMFSKQAVQTKQILSKQAVKIAKQAEEHERFINKVTHLLGVLSFGGFCFLLGARPQDIRYVYCLFYVIFVPLRWIYYRYKKWHYYLLGPLAWALIVWRCSLVFSSLDKLVSVLIHLLPGLVFFTIRWWDPAAFAAMHPEGTSPRASWPYVEHKSYLWAWLFMVPLVAYTLWQVLYFLIVNVLRRQRLLRDPEVMTSYRELSKKAQKANNVWWRLSGLLGDQNRLFMYILLQAIFTVATMALTVPIFLSYELHAFFQLLKVSASVWNGGSFLLEVMPRQVILKEKKKSEAHPVQTQQDQPSIVAENTTIENHNSTES